MYCMVEIGSFIVYIDVDAGGGDGVADGGGITMEIQKEKSIEEK